MSNATTFEVHPLDNPDSTLRYLTRKLAEAEREAQARNKEVSKARERAQAAGEEYYRLETDLHEFIESLRAEAAAALDNKTSQKAAT